MIKLSARYPYEISGVFFVRIPAGISSRHPATSGVAGGVMIFVVRMISSFERQRYIAHVVNLSRMFCFTILFHRKRTDPIPTTVDKPFVIIASFLSVRLTRALRFVLLFVIYALIPISP